MILTAGFACDKRSSYSELKNSLRARPAKGKQPEKIPLIVLPGTEPAAPECLDFYRKAVGLKEQLEGTLSQASDLVRRRKKAAFDPLGSLDKDVERLFGRCHVLLKELETEVFDETTAGSDFGPSVGAIRWAMRTHLKAVLQSLARRVKFEEGGYARMLQGLEKSEKSSFDFINDLHIEESSQSFIGEDGTRVVVKELSNTNRQEIERVVSSAHQLTDLMTQINEMAVEQGSVVDRIDVSLKETLNRTKRGNEELLRARREMEKGCAAKLMRLLIVANLIVFVLLALKYW